MRNLIKILTNVYVCYVYQVSLSTDFVTNVHLTHMIFLWWTHTDCLWWVSASPSVLPWHFLSMFLVLYTEYMLDLHGCSYQQEVCYLFWTVSGGLLLWLAIISAIKFWHPCPLLEMLNWHVFLMIILENIVISEVTNPIWCIFELSWVRIWDRSWNRGQAPVSQNFLTSIFDVS